MKKRISLLSLLLSVCLLISACSVSFKIKIPKTNKETVLLTRNDWSDDVREAGENGFDFNTGFLTEYAGYHSHP